MQTETKQNCKRWRRHHRR